MELGSLCHKSYGSSRPLFGVFGYTSHHHFRGIYSNWTLSSVEKTSLRQQVFITFGYHRTVGFNFNPRIIREVICHYTTLNQEVTLSANDIPDANGDQEFHLDLSDDTADTSTSDDEVSTYCFSCFSI